MLVRANYTRDRTRELQRALYRAAKASAARRFHALFDKVSREDTLRRAWREVKANAGAAGVDGQTISDIEQRGGEQFLVALAAAVGEGRYRPRPVRRVGGEFNPSEHGVPQGSVISPLLANVMLHELDRLWEDCCRGLGQLVRYADDLVILCKTEGQAREGLRRVGLVLDRLGLTLHPDKTRVVFVGDGRDG